MKLYHFCTKATEESIRAEGLTKGVIAWPLEHGGYRLIRPVQWLTDEPDPEAQGWATDTLGVCGDRVEVRLSLDMPQSRFLQRWREFARVYLRLSVHDLIHFAEAGGGGDEHWWVYLGEIGPGAIS